LILIGDRGHSKKERDITTTNTIIYSYTYAYYGAIFLAETSHENALFLNFLKKKDLLEEIAMEAKGEDDERIPFDLKRLFVEREDIALSNLLPRLNRSTDVKFLYDTCTLARDVIRKYLNGEELPKKFKLAEMSSRSTIEWAFERVAKPHVHRRGYFLRRVQRDNNNADVLRFVSEKRIEETADLRERLKKKAKEKKTGYCDCCKTRYHWEFVSTFDRGYLRPTERGGDGKRRCFSACGTCFYQYVPIGFGHPSAKEGTDDQSKEIWEKTSYCEICDQMYSRGYLVSFYENPITINTKNGNSQRVDMACGPCYDKHVPYGHRLDY